MKGQTRLPRGGTIAVVAFALVLLSAWLIGPPAGTGATLANRPIEDPPELTASALLDTATFAQAEAALTDRVRLKPWAVAGVNAAVLEVTGRSPSAQVVASGDQWFYAGEFTEPCPYLGSTDAAAKGLRTLQAAADKGGKQVLFVVVPNKSTTLSDQVPRPQQSLQACSIPNRNALQQLADQRGSSLAIVDPQRVRDLAGDDAYWPRDTHWTTNGGRALTELLAQRFASPEQAQRTMHEIAVTRSVDHQEDLVPLLGLTGTVTTPQWEPREPSQFEPLESSSPWPPRAFTSPNPIPGAPTAAIIYDSFVYAPLLEPQLASLFPSGLFVQWDAVDTLPQLPRQEVVIIESTERLALGRLAGMQPGGPFDPLLEYLATTQPSD